MLSNRTLDARELNGVANQDGNRHIVALGSNRFAIELDEYIALMDDIAHLRMYGKVLALELNGVQANVNQNVQAINRVKRNGMSRGKNRFDLASAGAITRVPVG